MSVSEWSVGSVPSWPPRLMSEWLVGREVDPGSLVEEMLEWVRYLRTQSPDYFGVVDDGFGSVWPRCSADCELVVVRPGKAQCDCEVEGC